MSHSHDLLVIGGGSAGLVAARFAVTLGATVALAEADRIGGDCTWTGCVPSKALLRAARAAREVRTAGRFGVRSESVRVNMEAVHAYVQDAIAAVYRREAPDVLGSEGVEVLGAASFLDAARVSVGARVLKPRRILICTGATPHVPPVPGLDSVPYLTHETVFENRRLPGHLLVLGAGPLGLELATAYEGLGAQVTVLGEELLPTEDPDVRAAVRDSLEGRGVKVVNDRATSVRSDGDVVELTWPEGRARGDLLLVATGRRPRTTGLGLERAAVRFDGGGIEVDDHLRTSVPHIYAAGDVTGGVQFTHYAAWQGFQAVRNALLPGRARGVSSTVPRVTFLDPEVASVGLTEAQARARHGAGVVVRRRALQDIDRGVTDGRVDGFVKVITDGDDEILGASIVAPRAGEMVVEVMLAMRHGLSPGDLASTLHPYPTWSTGLQQLVAEDATTRFRSSLTGRLALWLSGLGSGAS